MSFLRILWSLVLLSLAQLRHLVLAIENVYPNGEATEQRLPFLVTWTTLER